MVLCNSQPIPIIIRCYFNKSSCSSFPCFKRIFITIVLIRFSTSFGNKFVFFFAVSSKEPEIISFVFFKSLLKFYKCFYSNFFYSNSPLTFFLRAMDGAIIYSIYHITFSTPDTFEPSKNIKANLPGEEVWCQLVLLSGIFMPFLWHPCGSALLSDG